jgi:methionine synthase / methylenetetrahydrofolate reductase(NADPH)
MAHGRSSGWLEQFSAKPQVIQGAMGTELLAHGYNLGDDLCSLNQTQPELIANIHQRYLKAGATVLKTNSFGAHPRQQYSTIQSSQVYDITRKSVQIARSCGDQNTLVWGSVGPTGMDRNALSIHRDELFRGYQEPFSALLTEGVDGILLETFGSVAEVEMAIQSLRQLDSSIPVVASMFLMPNGSLSDGTTWEQWLRASETWNLQGWGINCCTPENAVQAIKSCAWFSKPMIVMPSAGIPVHEQDGWAYPISNQQWLADIRPLFSSANVWFGGCCGTNPTLIGKLASQSRQRDSD